MGRAKEMMLEMEHEPLSGVSDRLVSAHLFKNKLVHDYVFKHGFDGTCSYCGDTTKVLPLRLIVEKVDSIVLRYFGDPNNEGLGWDSHFDDEDVPGFHSEGGGYITPNNRYFNDDMRQLLFDTGFRVENDDLESDIAAALGYHMQLVEKDPYGLNGAEERWVDWQYIKQSAVNMAKSGQSLEAMLRAEAARLDYLKSDIYQAQTPLQIERELTLYRTVNYNSKRRPLLYRDLTSPPVKFTGNMRMSAKGDSVFYGATGKETTLQEAVKEKGNTYCYVGLFRTKHPLRLLDLTGIPGNLTIYDQEQYHLLLFLRNFCEAVSEYVPNHDAIQYAPTQLITYFFRNKLKHYDQNRNAHPIDGILFTSSKNGATNAVLFYDNKTSSEHLELLEWELMYNGRIKHHIYSQWMKNIEVFLAIVRRMWMCR